MCKNCVRMPPHCVCVCEYDVSHQTARRSAIHMAVCAMKKRVINHYIRLKGLRSQSARRQLFRKSIENAYDKKAFFSLSFHTISWIVNLFMTFRNKKKTKEQIIFRA